MVKKSNWLETKMPTQFVLQGFYFQLAWTKFWSMSFGLISFETIHFMLCEDTPSYELKHEKWRQS